MNRCIVVSNGICFHSPHVAGILKQKLYKRCLSNPLAVHVCARFNQVLTSALVQNIKGLDDGPFFELSAVIVLLVDLEAHQI